MISLVDSSRKSVAHPAELSSLHVAQTEETGDDSSKTIGRPQDKSMSTLGQSSSQLETQVSQGQVAFILSL